jgi:hypothetical protein
MSLKSKSRQQDPSLDLNFAFWGRLSQTSDMATSEIQEGVREQWRGTKVENQFGAITTKLIFEERPNKD